jgi:hypothetical protein
MDRRFSYRLFIDANAETCSACDVAPLGPRIDGLLAVQLKKRTRREEA